MSKIVNLKGQDKRLVGEFRRFNDELSKQDRMDQLLEPEDRWDYRTWYKSLGVWWLILICLGLSIYAGYSHACGYEEPEPIKIVSPAI